MYPGASDKLFYTGIIDLKAPNSNELRDLRVSPICFWEAERQAIWLSLRVSQNLSLSFPRALISKDIGGRFAVQDSWKAG